MPTVVHSATVFGFDGKSVSIEVDILNGLCSFTIVGLGDAAVMESKERIRSAIKNSGAEYPRRKKTVNLAPADLRKHGPQFDLPIAVGLLVESKQLPAEPFEKIAVFGELSLAGLIRPIPGILSLAWHAKCSGFEGVLVPSENAREAGMVEGIKVLAAENLREIIDFGHGKKDLGAAAIFLQSDQNVADNIEEFSSVLESIIGLEQAKRAVLIAAAGGHNILILCL